MSWTPAMDHYRQLFALAKQDESLIANHSRVVLPCIEQGLVEAERFLGDIKKANLERELVEEVAVEVAELRQMVDFYSST